MDTSDPVIRELIALGERHDSIRALVMTSARCNPNARPDVFSDYDVEIFTEDPDQFAKSDQWFRSLGTVLVSLLLRQDRHTLQRGWSLLVVYEDSTKIDFQVNHLEKLSEFAKSLPDGYDIGYTVLLDKDGLTASLKPPTHRAYIPTIPTETEYARVVNGFWWNSTYVSKYLWRDDLMAAKRMLDNGSIHDELRTMLEWSVEIERGWNWKPGQYGRDIKKALDPDTYRELAEVYAGGDIEEMWESFFRTIALFRKVAIKVGDKLGYKYLHDLDRKVTIYHQTVRGLDRQATEREELARLLKEAYAEAGHS